MNRAVPGHERRERIRLFKEQQKRKGVQYPPVPTLPNRKSGLKTVAEEKAVVQEATEEKLRIYQLLLPGLLKKLTRISDPRSPGKVKHKITVLMLYGILMFAFQMGSRHQTNREMTTPQLLENLRALFPELKEMPHRIPFAACWSRSGTCLSNGMVLPLLSEFLENSPELEMIESDAVWKQGQRARCGDLPQELVEIRDCA